MTTAELPGHLNVALAISVAEEFLRARAADLRAQGPWKRMRRPIEWHGTAPPPPIRAAIRSRSRVNGGLCCPLTALHPAGPRSISSASAMDVGRMLGLDLRAALLIMNAADGVWSLEPRVRSALCRATGIEDDACGIASPGKDR